jgi:hypothetical protein
MSLLNHWDPLGFTSSTFDKVQQYRKNKKLNQIMGELSGKCTYTYNELGFRGDSIKKDGFKIMSIGCSLTEGYGVNDNETWSHYLSKMIPNGVDLNFGVSSTSNDYISRCLTTFYDIIKPDLVIIFYTFPQRKEYVDENNNIENVMVRHDHTKFWFPHHYEKHICESIIELSNENIDLTNWYRNHLLIKNFLENKKCKWVWNGDLIQNNEIKEFNRVDGGFLNDNNNFLDYAVDNLHPGPLTNKRYSETLFNFINEDNTKLSLSKKLI